MTRADLPPAAATKALSALDEFDAAANQYGALLDAQRALLARDNSVGAAELASRGDAMARSAAQCGRRLAPVREALRQPSVQGPRADEIRRRVAAAECRTAVLAAAAAEIAGRCGALRVAAEAELVKAQRAVAARDGLGYRTGPHLATLDTQG